VDSKPLVAIFGRPEAKMVAAQEEMKACVKAKKACLKKLEACLEKTEVNHEKLEANIESYPERTEANQEKLEVKMETNQEKTETISEHCKWLPSIKLHTFLLPFRPMLYIFHKKSLNKQHMSRLMECVWSLSSDSIT
jgi:hypothetical protein